MYQVIHTNKVKFTKLMACANYQRSQCQLHADALYD